MKQLKIPRWSCELNFGTLNDVLLVCRKLGLIVSNVKMPAKDAWFPTVFNCKLNDRFGLKMWPNVKNKWDFTAKLWMERTMISDLDLPLVNVVKCDKTMWIWRCPPKMSDSERCNDEKLNGQVPVQHKTQMSSRFMWLSILHLHKLNETPLTGQAKRWKLGKWKMLATNVIRSRSFKIFKFCKLAAEPSQASPNVARARVY